ncbi:L-serine ammonia-lyase, iron-sulfur-dependent, subunit beta [Gracilinema caldarium]|uniref:L-serine ammonia-lyase n=1 Tax=Gracilinema caldarium (strain ATCC 51460 / DSM 7334 / H1) TaxID=744872 RepID=F8EYL6_GRAC1|nr:L-serine ammonia-lyase, iron-sulfur-dependent, subunit alpha [Gracilinema caldarium]AEJ18593.1 L-serine dehydratase, iron-sulfur-dependent, alpha subunit [Gracilinema caldarium DSM 7334]
MKYQFSTLKELYEILESERLTIDEYLLQREAFLSGKNLELVIAELDRRIAITRQALIRGLSEPQQSRSGLTQGAAYRYLRSSNRIVRDPFFHRTVAYALSINEVNACGGKIVAFPTAGSSGIVPAVIWAYWDSFVPEESKAATETNSETRVISVPRSLDPPYSRSLRSAFLIASLVGIFIAQGATLAGAEGGCQAECGSAGAMAAAALASLQGASLETCFHAAALSLKNALGLACDPVAGLVEVPCVKRNGFMATNALTAVELALAGIQSRIPFEEVIQAMKQIGESLPASIRESAEGGLAVTPTGLYYKKLIMGGE